MTFVLSCEAKTRNTSVDLKASECLSSRIPRGWRDRRKGGTSSWGIGIGGLGSKFARGRCFEVEGVRELSVTSKGKTQVWNKCKKFLLYISHEM